MAVQAVVAAAGAVASNVMTVGAHLSAIAPLQRMAGYLANGAIPNELPPVPMCVAAYRAGYLDADLTRFVCSANGVFPPDDILPPQGLTTLSDMQPILTATWKAAYKTTTQVLSPNESLVAWNRGLIGEHLVDQYLLHQGFIDDEVQHAIKGMRFEIPGASDLVAFALKEAWDPQVVAQFGYDQEFPQPFSDWMKAAGFGGDARTPQQIADGAPLVDWAKLYWRTHWQVISPGQAYEMFQRLRPERIAHWQQLFPGVNPFTITDVETILKIADYPPAFRLQLTAMSYKLPRIRDVQNWYEYGIIDADEVEQIAKDSGYTPQDAVRRRKQVVYAAREKFEKKLRINPIPGIYRAYSAGILDKAEAARLLYMNAQVGTIGDDQWLQMDINQQQVHALADPNVKAALNQLDLDFNTKRTAKVVADSKRAYQKGIQSWDQVNAFLIDYGITPINTQFMKIDWDRELFAGKLLASTAQIRRLVLKQIIPVKVAMTWLTNLGWRDPEITAIIAELQRDLLLELGKAQEAVAKTVKQKQKALEMQLKAANTAKAKATQKLLNTISPSQATRYFTHGVFQLADLSTALQRHDYQGVALAAALKDAQVKRQDYLDAKAKANAAAATAAAKAKAAADKAKAGKDASA